MLFLKNHIQVSVTAVANIGEQLPNADAKVFEVVVKLTDQIRS